MMLGGSAHFVDRGEHELKGIDGVVAPVRARARLNIGHSTVYRIVPTGGREAADL